MQAVKGTEPDWLDLTCHSFVCGHPLTSTGWSKPVAVGERLGQEYTLMARHNNNKAVFDAYSDFIMKYIMTIKHLAYKSKMLYMLLAAIEFLSDPRNELTWIAMKASWASSQLQCQNAETHYLIKVRSASWGYVVLRSCSVVEPLHTDTWGMLYWIQGCTTARNWYV